MKHGVWISGNCAQFLMGRCPRQNTHAQKDCKKREPRVLHLSCGEEGWAQHRHGQPLWTPMFALHSQNPSLQSWMNDQVARSTPENVMSKLSDSI